MTNPTGAPAAPEATTGTSGAPAAPAPGQQPAVQTGQSGTDQGIANPEAKRYADEAAAYRVQLKKLEAENAKLREATQTEQEKLIAAAKLEGSTQYKAKLAKAIAENTAISILAERSVVAPELALRSLDLSNVDVDADTGTVNRDAITKAIDALLERYPMLVNSTSGPALPPVGSVTGADQRRLQAGQVVRPAALDDQAKLNELARYALGSGNS